jgi:hypothetical protein
MGIKSFLSNLFTRDTNQDNSLQVKDTNQIVFDTENNINVLPAKFFLMNMVEISNEAPPLEEMKGILSEGFPKLSDSDYFKLNAKLFSMIDYVASKGNTPQTWEPIYTHTFSQLQNISGHEQKQILSELYATAFILKSTDEQEKVASNYVYRLQLAERYVSLSKSELIRLIEDEKNKVGYDVTEISPRNEEKGSSKKFTNTSNSNPHQSEGSLPNYVQEAIEELDTAKNNCKVRFNKYGMSLEALIKKASISGTDKSFIQTIIGHGTHSNFDKINSKDLLKLTMKYSFALDMNFKGEFKSHESEFMHTYGKFVSAKEKYDKIMAKLSRQNHI